MVKSTKSHRKGAPPVERYSEMPNPGTPGLTDKDTNTLTKYIIRFFHRTGRRANISTVIEGGLIKFEVRLGQVNKVRPQGVSRAGVSRRGLVYHDRP